MAKQEKPRVVQYLTKNAGKVLEEVPPLLEEDEAGASEEDVAYFPGPNADPYEEIEHHINGEVLKLYDVYSYRHAAAILKNTFPAELSEIEEALLNLKITVRDIGLPGGSESEIPKKLSAILRPKNWLETRIQGDLVVRVFEHSEQKVGGKAKKFTIPKKEPVVLANYIDGHKIDYVKGRVALDLEWNSKDQTYDRDLYAFRTFHECGITSAAALITRSEKMNEVFDIIPKLDKKGNPVGGSVRKKYGASHTGMGKLLYRLNAGRHGGCPVLVFGIRPDIVVDLYK